METLAQDIYLKRAYGLISEVDKATEGFRASAVQHNQQLDEDKPFLQMMATGFKGKRQLEQQKSALLADLKLAGEEVDRAAALGADGTVETRDGVTGLRGLRAMIWYAKGQLELVWGKSDKAREFFTSSIQVADSAEARYMLGLILEDEYQPAEALKEFEKCLELDPAGELSVPALREANAMKNYRKKFRGSWPLFILLLFFPFPIVFGVLYFVAKRK